MQHFPSNPVSAIRAQWRHRQLIMQLTKREISGRYRGSLFGSAWSLINPLLLLAIYTFVFSTVFKSRWPGMQTDSKFDFALILFTGLIPFNFFCEIFSRAPTLIIANGNYVKRVVFPLEILPTIALLAAAFHVGLNMMVLLAFQLMIHHTLHWSLLYALPMLLGLAITSQGVAWLLAAIGTYFRDLGQITGMAVTVLMFMSPIFYPVKALPENFQAIVHLNPLTFVIEELRSVVLWGGSPTLAGWMIYFAASFAVASAGYWLFQKTRAGFADVL